MALPIINISTLIYKTGGVIVIQIHKLHTTRDEDDTERSIT